MSPRTILLSFVGEISYYFLDALAELTVWWRRHDMDGRRLREEVVAAAPEHFEEDGMPVVVDSAASFVFLCDGRGFYLEHRRSKATLVVREGGMRRYRCWGVRGLRREGAKLNRVKGKVEMKKKKEMKGKEAEGGG